MKIDDSGIISPDEKEKKTDKKEVIAFTAVDEKNEQYLPYLINSLRKFHSEKELPLHIVKGDELKAYLKDDPMFFYRQKPVIAEKLIKDYSLVIGLDADQIITGDLSYLWKTYDYDVATVLNWNRYDINIYGLVQGWGIAPLEYFNCGLVAMRSEEFVHHWNIVSHSEQFNRLQYKEQDLLNVLCYYGNYNVRCLDHFDGPAKMNSWWGLISKGEWKDAKLQDGKIIIPKGKGNTPFPPREIDLKVIHWGGGKDGVKMNYNVFFPPEVAKHLDYLVSDKK